MTHALLRHPHVWYQARLSDSTRCTGLQKLKLATLSLRKMCPMLNWTLIRFLGRSLSFLAAAYQYVSSMNQFISSLLSTPPLSNTILILPTCPLQLVIFKTNSNLTVSIFNQNKKSLNGSNTITNHQEITIFIRILNILSTKIANSGIQPDG